MHGTDAGHHAAVVELSAAAEQPGLLLSLSKDGNVRLWDVGRQECLLSLKTDAYAVVGPRQVSG